MVIFCSSYSDPAANNHKPIQIAGFVMFAASFFLLLILFFNTHRFFNTKDLTILQFMAATVVIGAILLVGVYTGFPSLLFSNQLFASKDYAASQLINTLIALTVIGLFVVVAVVLFYKKTTDKKSNFLVRRVFFLLYLLFYILKF